MSVGLSLGVNHQMLVDEYSPKAIDDSQALDDVTDRLSESSASLSDGNEALVMIAAHAPEAIPTDMELELLLHRVREAVMTYMGGNAGDPHVKITGMDDPVIDTGLEDYKQVLLAAKDRVLKAIRWLAKQFMNAYKRLSDRLGRLSVRMMMIERKIDSSSDNALPTDTVVLPPSAAMLSMLGKKPANASEVMNAVNKVKWLFTTIHNDFTLFQNTFKRAVDSGNRAEVLEIIKDFLGHLSSRLNTRPDPQRNGHQVFNQLPNSYIVELSIGDSFTDCWATINRVGMLNVAGEESRRPDRASLSRLISEQRNFLKIVNELYGKVGSRLTSDFRNLVREAERSLDNGDKDNRTVEATINWFTEQQNRLFYRTMVLACGVMSAALDYCVVALRAAGVGTEGLDDEIVGEGATSRLNLINQHMTQRQSAVDGAMVGVTILNSALEAFEEGKYDPDFSVKQILEMDLDALQFRDEPMSYNHWMWSGTNLGDYPRSLTEVLKTVDRELGSFSDDQYEEFKALLCARTVSTGNDAASRVLTRHGYLGETGYVQYLLNDGATPTSSAGVMEGAVAGVLDFDKLLAAFRKRTQLVAGSLHDTDVIVSQLYNAVGPGTSAPMVDVTLTGGFSVTQLSAFTGFSDVNLARASLDSESIYHGDVPACDAEAYEVAQELIVKLVAQDKSLADHWGEINQLVQHARLVQNILADSMAKCNDGKADEWLCDGIRYLSMLFHEVRWQIRLLRDLLMYREGMLLSLCFYQRTMGGC